MKYITSNLKAIFGRKEKKGKRTLNDLDFTKSEIVKHLSEKLSPKHQEKLNNSSDIANFLKEFFVNEIAEKYVAGNSEMKKQFFADFLVDYFAILASENFKEEGEQRIDELLSQKVELFLEKVQQNKYNSIHKKSELTKLIQNSYFGTLNKKDIRPDLLEKILNEMEDLYKLDHKVAISTLSKIVEIPESNLKNLLSISKNFRKDIDKISKDFSISSNILREAESTMYGMKLGESLVDLYGVSSIYGINGLQKLYKTVENYDKFEKVTLKETFGLGKEKATMESRNFSENTSANSWGNIAYSYATYLTQLMNRNPIIRLASEYSSTIKKITGHAMLISPIMYPTFMEYGLSIAVAKTAGLMALDYAINRVSDYNNDKILEKYFIIKNIESNRRIQQEILHNIDGEIKEYIKKQAPSLLNEVEFKETYLKLPEYLSSYETLGKSAIRSTLSELSRYLPQIGFSIYNNPIFNPASLTLSLAIVSKTNSNLKQQITKDYAESENKKLISLMKLDGQDLDQLKQSLKIEEDKITNISKLIEEYKILHEKDINENTVGNENILGLSGNLVNTELKSSKKLDVDGESAKNKNKKDVTLDVDDEKLSNSLLKIISNSIDSIIKTKHYDKKEVSSLKRYLHKDLRSILKTMKKEQKEAVNSAIDNVFEKAGLANLLIDYVKNLMKKYFYDSKHSKNIQFTREERNDLAKTLIESFKDFDKMVRTKGKMKKFNINLSTSKSDTLPSTPYNNAYTNKLNNEKTE